MRLPVMSANGAEKRRVLCGGKGLFEIGERGEDARIFAEHLDLSRLPLLAPEKPRTSLTGIGGEVLQVFSNGECVCLLTRAEGAYRALLYDAAAHELWSLDLPTPREGAFLYAHAWRGERLYLPAFSAIVDLAARVLLPTDKPLVGGESKVGYDETLAKKNRHTVCFLEADFSHFPVGEYVTVRYRRLDEAWWRVLLVQIQSVNAEAGEITLQGEGAPDLLNSRPGTVSVGYDLPLLNGIFADHERLYGFSRNRIYISAKDEEALCFTPVAVHTPDEAAVIIEVDAELTGGCMYGDRPVFFTDGAVLRVVEDSELGFRVSTTPTVGVTPRAAVSPAVIGDRICYFSRHGLALFDGKEGRVVRSGIRAPKGGAAVADGRFYSFFASGANGQSLYAYDAAKDLLYDLGGGRQLGVAHTLGGVLIATEYTGEETRLVLFCERDALPYPISQMVSDGVLAVLESAPERARLVLGDVRGDTDICSPVEITVDAKIGADATVTISLYLDDEQTPYQTHTLTGTGGRTVHRLSCLPRRCGAYRLELCGEGDFCVFTVNTVERG